ncbi:MAG TPA: hypothetical protein VFA98_09885, partial [Thermoanaerobaculia bacterium]|nr:hypothetical protein [Thermoanaerobaculia bacterium]
MIRCVRSFVTIGIAMAAATARAGVGVWTTNGPADFPSYSPVVADSRIPGTLYAGTQTGIAKSIDNGATWSDRTVSSTLSAYPLAAANGTAYASVATCTLPYALNCSSTVYESTDG